MKIKNQLSTFYFSSLNLKKNEIGHGFSLFIFQLAEKMNDPKIHALTHPKCYNSRSPFFLFFTFVFSFCLLFLFFFFFDILLKRTTTLPSPFNYHLVFVII